MRFDCGETAEERQERLKDWHPFFAVFPRRLSIEVEEPIKYDRWFSDAEELGMPLTRKVSKLTRDCRWLEWIECRGIPNWVWDWDYREKRT